MHSEPSEVDGDRRARFDAVFRRVYEPLQRYARRRIGPALADDVVAETLLVLWRRFDEVPIESALAWSYGIARRCLANQRRGEHRREALIDRMAADNALAADGGADLLDDELEQALAELSADDREIVRLWAWEQLQPRDIAVVLSISPNAAAIRVHRAKQRLADAFQRKSAAAGGHTQFGHAKETP